MPQRIQETARSIANAVLATDTDYRGNLFQEISVLLSRADQHYTAQQFAQLAREYGVNPNGTAASQDKKHR
jgi:thymidine kinase